MVDRIDRQDGTVFPGTYWDKINAVRDSVSKKFFANKSIEAISVGCDLWRLVSAGVAKMAAGDTKDLEFARAAFDGNMAMVAEPVETMLGYEWYRTSSAVMSDEDVKYDLHSYIDNGALRCFVTDVDKRNEETAVGEDGFEFILWRAPLPQRPPICICFCKKENLGTILSLSKAATRLSRQDMKADSKSLYIYNINLDMPLGEEFDWDNIILSEKVNEEVRQDFDFFCDSEEWFMENKIPFRRGYLFTGPPGNGKTMICRAMATKPRFSAIGFDFSDPDRATNGFLMRTFQYAQQIAPTVLLLEDIDHVFGRNAKVKTKVSLDCLLNQLDGIAQNRGLVIAATTNHPEDLDMALLSRPGRFDRVIEIQNPDEKLRASFIQHLFGDKGLDESFLKELVEKTDGYSMAYIKAIYINAMLKAYNSEDKTLKKEHVLSGLKSSRIHFDKACAWSPK